MDEVNCAADLRVVYLTKGAYKKFSENIYCIARLKSQDVSVFSTDNHKFPIVISRYGIEKIDLDSGEVKLNDEALGNIFYGSGN